MIRAEASVAPKPAARGSRRARLFVAAAIGVALLLAADQFALRVLLADGEFLGRRMAPFDPPLFHAPQRDAFRRLAAHVETGTPPASEFQHDRELGWAPPRDGNIGHSRFDWAGARVGPRPLERERRPGLRRIVAVGCSFTYGQEVADEEAWPARLAEARTDVEIANLGMGAYGIDQALLRYLRDGRPLSPDEVWLGLLPSAAQRVITLYRPAQRHWTHSPLFKPRYVVDERGSLRFVANPAPTLEHAYRLLSRQEDFFAALLPHDAFVRRWPAAYAPAGSRLVHHSGFGRLLLTALEAGGRDTYAALRDPESEARCTLAAIVRHLAVESAADGARLRLLILPGPQDIADLRERGEPSWSGLVQELAREGLAVVDPSAEIAARDDERPGALWAPQGHYSAEGNLLVAEILARLLD